MQRLIRALRRRQRSHWACAEGLARPARQAAVRAVCPRARANQSPLIRAFRRVRWCAARFRRLCGKIFSQGEFSRLPRAGAGRSRTRGAAVRASTLQHRVVTHCRKVHFIGTSALSAIFRSKFCQAKSLRRSIGVAKAPRTRWCRAPRPLYTKLSGTTVLFLPLV